MKTRLMKTLITLRRDRCQTNQRVSSAYINGASAVLNWQTSPAIFNYRDKFVPPELSVSQVTDQYPRLHPTLSTSCCSTCLATSRSCIRTLISSFSCSRRPLFFSTLSSWMWRRMDTSFATWEDEERWWRKTTSTDFKRTLLGKQNLTSFYTVLP